MIPREWETNVFIAGEKFRVMRQTMVTIKVGEDAVLVVVLGAGIWKSATTVTEDEFSISVFRAEES